MGEGNLDSNKVELQQVPAQKTETKPETIKSAEATQTIQKTQERTEKLNKEVMTYNNAFKEVDSKLILDIKDTISNTINVNFETLKPEQRENIKLGILGKMLNIEALGLITNKFSGKLQNMSSLLAKQDFDSLSKTFDDTEDFGKNQADISKQILDKFKEEVVTLKAFVDKNKTNPALDNFLKSPKNISEFSDKTDLSNYVEASGEDERKFFHSVKNKLDKYDDKLKEAEETKEKVLNFTANSPEFISNGIIKFFSFLCGLPMIGDFLKKFLGVKGSTEEEIEKELNLQNIERKSLNNLRTYGIRYNKKWEPIESKNNPAISIFKNKDLSKISYKKMEKFFTFCKKNNLKINAEDFWYNVFEKKTIKTETKDESGNKTEKIVNFNLNIDESKDFYTSSNEPNFNFYGKLDSFVDTELKIAEVKEEKPKTPETPTPKKRVSPITVASGGAVPLVVSHNVPKSQAPEQTQEKKELPEDIIFHKESQIATIDRVDYKIKVSYGMNLPIENVILDKTSGNLKLDLGALYPSKEANVKLYKELSEKGEYNWEGEGLESGQSLKITKTTA